MKKNSSRMVAMVLSVLMLLCATVMSFAVNADADSARDADEQGATVPAAPITKADYYSRNADMNEDWMLNSADARTILRIAAKLDWIKDPYWLPKGVVFGDLDENGVVNSADARWVLRISARLSTVKEAIAAEATRPTSTPSSSPSVVTPSQKPSTVTTTVPTVTKNPNELKAPICNEYALTVTSASGVKYIMATDGVNCYISSADVKKDIAVYIDRDGNTYLLNGSDKEYAQFKEEFIKKAGFDIQKIRKFIADFYVPEYGVFEDCKVSDVTIDSLPYRLAERSGYKFYFYLDGSLLKIHGKDFAGKQGDFKIESVSDDAAEYMDLLSSYKKVSTNMFILKNGLSILS